MEMTLSKLRHRFPHALPHVVEDVDDWLARMDWLLDVLKGAVHQQRVIDVETLLASSLPSTRWVQRFRQLRATRSDLAPLLDAVAFLQFTSRRRGSLAALDWIDEHAAALSQLVDEGAASRDLQLTLCTLRDDIHADALPLFLDSMTDVSFHSVPVGNVYAYAEELSGELKKAANGEPFEIPEKPSVLTIGEAFRNLLRLLLGSKPKARRNATELLKLFFPLDFASKPRALRTHAESEESRLLEQLEQVQNEGLPFEGLPKRRKREQKRKLKEAANFVVSDHDTRRLLEDVHFALLHIPAIIEDQPQVRQWTQLAAHLPCAERSLRLGLFAGWEKGRLRSDEPKQANRQFREVVSGFCRLFARRGVHQSLLHLWRQYVASNDRHFLEDPTDVFYGKCVAREAYRQWARLLEATIYDRNVSIGPELFSSFGDFVQATSDIDRAGQLVAALAESEDDCYCEDEIRATLSIANEESDLVAILKELDDNCEIVEPVRLLGRYLREDRLRRIVEQWVVAGDNKSLLRLASCTQLVVDLGCSVPEIAETESSSDWLTRYPGELQEPLAALLRVTCDADVIAAQLLRKEFPDPDDLRRELDAVRQKLESLDRRQTQSSRERLRRRLESLQARINQPPAVTQQRLENLIKKVETRVDHEIVNRYVKECHAKATEKLQAAYGVRQSPEELLAPPYDKLLVAVLQLRGRMKELGLRLLLESQHDPKCDFRTEPENALFLRKIQDKGVRLEPWLSESLERTAKTANGEPYRLSFSREILDILLMGFHFDTCLSPGSFSFFSTIANAIDINKQVVYGKTESGRVVGRCLFALADNGGLLTYYRYAHDAADGFDEEVGHFAHQLAGAMNTFLDSRGPVSTLVAKRWYDDGAVSSDSIYDMQNPDGTVRTILRTEDASKITMKLIKFFGSEQALRDVLGSLLSLAEFRTRKEIVDPFIGQFGFDATVPIYERFRLAILARFSGRAETARQIVGALRINSLPRRLKRFECCDCAAFHGVGSYREVFGLLMECNPSIALRAIRLTRPKDVKSDAEETNAVRKRMLMRCHQLLGREPGQTEKRGR